jgi:hypothetical protein
MKLNELKSTAKAVNELGESYCDALNALSGASNEVKMVRKLWRKENKPHCVSLGLTLIALPDPFIVTDLAGAALLAFGLIQYKVKNSALYLEDIYKTFPKLLKELNEIRFNHV